MKLRRQGLLVVIALLALTAACAKEEQATPPAQPAPLAQPTPAPLPPAAPAEPTPAPAIAPAPSLAPAPTPKPAVTIQILSVSDWHAQLDPLSVPNVGNVGGAAVILAYWKRDRAASPNTLTLTAGDSFGATPPLSSFFQEEPAVRAMNLMGFDADTLGNHNFDKGIAHLQRMVDLAKFSFVSANLKNVETNLKNVPPFKIFDIGGVKVAVIGVTNPEAPTLVAPSSFGTMEVTDPVLAAYQARVAARAAGAQVFIAITHLGVTSTDATTATADGPLIEFATALRGFDVILGDHTDVQFSGTINDALVVENRSKGLTYARIKLTIDSQSGRVATRSAEFVTPLVSKDLIPDPAVQTLIDGLKTQLAPILNIVVGNSAVAVPQADSCGQSQGRTCESLVGNVITDALRTTYGVDFAITNAGGLRANLTCPATDNPDDFCPGYTKPPFPITRGQVQAVLPFGNVVVTLRVDGAELKTLLENGVSRMPSAAGRFPQVSGLCFTYDIAGAAGSRVKRAVRQAGDGTCTGAPIDLTTNSTYTIATNDFMASGGDGYPKLSGRATTRDIMDQVVTQYLTSNPQLSPAIQGRITCTSGGEIACPEVKR